jgi:transcriptional regulator of heat shock response
VIGPTRMRYSKAIDVVEGLSKAIDRMVNPGSAHR